ncbi:MAG: glycosyltransferase [Bryobacteraceae bacterium]
MIADWKEKIRPYYLRWLYFPLKPQARPLHYADTWNVPLHPLDEAGVRSNVAVDSRPPAFLFLPMSDWHARMLRSQHLALGMAALGHPAYYLNPHVGREYRKVRGADPEPRLGALSANVSELHVRLPREPVYHHRRLRASEDRILCSALEPLARVFGERVVQVVSLPTWTGAAFEMRRRHGWPVVYDCQDYLPGFGAMSGDILEAEQELFRAADWVIFVSSLLEEGTARSWPQVRGRSTVLRNAADTAHFARAAVSAPGRTGPPVLGYFGAIEDWLDWELLKQVAQGIPSARIVMAGRVESAAAARLARYPNVELAGEIPYERLPEWMKCFDVALIPFRRNPLTRAASPIKLYEYLAAGLPVVATELPELEPWSDLIYVARSEHHFVEQACRAMAESDPALRSRRMRAVSGHTWADRSEQLCSLLTGLRPASPRAVAAGTAR